MVTLLPWDEHVEGLSRGAGMPVFSETLATCTERAVERASVANLVVRRGTVLGGDALEAAAARGREVGHPCGLRLSGRLGELVAEASLGADPVAIWYGASADDDLSTLPVVDLDPAERLVDVRLGEGPMPLSDRLILRVDHHVQLLWANLLGLGSTLWRGLLHRHPVIAVLRAAWGGLRGGGLTGGHVARGLSAGAGVHRDATVEACLVGEGVVIEPGAVVRGCVLGPGARVEANAVCEASVLGPDAVVQRQAMLRFSLLGPAAMHGGAAQLAVYGAGASMKLGSYLMDQGFHQDVRVPVAGRFVRAPLGLAGVCLGEGSRIGSGVWIAPGRVIPPGGVVVAEQVLRSFERPAPYTAWSEE